MGIGYVPNKNPSAYYANITTAGASYAATQDGFVWGEIRNTGGDARTAQVLINGVPYAGIGGIAGTNYIIPLLFCANIRKGDVVETRSGVGTYNIFIC